MYNRVWLIITPFRKAYRQVAKNRMAYIQGIAGEFLVCFQEHRKAFDFHFPLHAKEDITKTSRLPSENFRYRMFGTLVLQVLEGSVRNEYVTLEN